MKLRRLIYKRKISILGLLMFVIIGTITLIFKIIKFTITKLYKSFIWFKHYIQFVKSGYCYSDIYNLIDNLSGREFEVFMYLVFKELGYKVKLTQATSDGGKDIILRDIDDEIIYVECKRWSDNFKVGRPEIQKLVGSSIGDSVDNMLFVTTGQYTNEAYEYAFKIDNLELWDMNDIMKKVVKINQKRIPYILTKTLGTNTKIVRLKPSVR